MNAPGAATGSGPVVDICLCERPRPALDDVMTAIGTLHVPQGVRVRVMVADGDMGPQARESVRDLAARLPHEVVRLPVPDGDICAAHNACLAAAEGDFLAFVDKGMVTRPWLMRLLGTALATEADAVLGPVRAVYGPGAPKWMHRADSHSTNPVWVKGEIRTGYTCNALLKLTSARLRKLRFVPELGSQGCAAMDFFARLHAAGGQIAYAPEAWVEEAVPPDRARFSWLLSHSFRKGRAQARLLARAEPPRPAAGAAVAAFRAMCSLAAAAAYLPFAARRNPHILRAAMQAGIVSGLVGRAAREPAEEG